jgi:mono/diheme cytochrome c family protein
MNRARNVFHLLTILFVGVIATVLSSSAAAEQVLQGEHDRVRTILDGVYTEEQALRGQEDYETTCAGCHNFDLIGARNSPLKGPQFLDKWREYNLDLLYGFISNSMPPRRTENPVILSDSKYLDILTYIIAGNGGPAGTEELTTEDLHEVLFVGPDGPQPLPLGALAMVVGCLERGPAGQWELTRTSRPIRSQALPFDATTEELISADAIALGTETLSLRDMAFVRNFSPEEHEGHKVQAKGLMIPGSERSTLSLTTMQSISADCSE